MIGKWLQDAIQQWRQNPRLRYAVLLVLAILAMHGVLKIADRRDELAKAWAHDQELMTRYREVVAEPRWPQRSAMLMQQWRDSVLALPHATTMGEAKAEQQVWLTKFASRNKLTAAKIVIQDALDVPAHPGMIQVVSRIDGDGVSPWLYADPLREAAAALPWRQVQRAEITAVNPGKLSLVFRNYYRNDTFPMPPAAVPGKTPATTALAASAGPSAAVATQPTSTTNATTSGSRSPVRPAAAGDKGVLNQVLDPAQGAAPDHDRTKGASR
ncbi:MAG: hypothetical protein JSS25_11665 [Proteobacteria bacterium]|nr:hypothetical protein [Pseudomonadota bacterium]